MTRLTEVEREANAKRLADGRREMNRKIIEAETTREAEATAKAEAIEKATDAIANQWGYMLYQVGVYSDMRETLIKLSPDNAERYPEVTLKVPPAKLWDDNYKTWKKSRTLY